MKKRRYLIAAISVLLAVILVLSGCKGKDDSVNKTAGGVGGSDLNSETVTAEPTTQSPRYTAQDKLIALTFDDGPRESTTNRILDVLAKNGGVATFFVVGYNIDGNASTIKRAKEMGCEIGNHSNDHKTLTKCSYDTLREQVDKPNEAIKTLTGSAPVLFRAPGGAFKGVTQDIGMPLIQWSVDTNDWKFKDAAHKGRSQEQRTADLNKIAENVIENAKKGDIVLMHDIYDFSADLCELIVPGLVEKGFKLVTVSEMYEAYGETLENGEVYYSINPDSPAIANPQPDAIIEPGKYTVATSGSVLNMRVEPDAGTQVIEKIPNGTQIDVTKAVKGWAYVTYNSASGWVCSAYLSKSA